MPSIFAHISSSGDTPSILQDMRLAGGELSTSRDGMLRMAFSGRIYNCSQIARELAVCGVVFPDEEGGPAQEGSPSQEELILEGYIQWGEEVLSRLRGMWSFIIWDQRDGSVFAARDRFGIKTLHYLRTESTFALSSQIGALLDLPGYERRLNVRALDLYLSFQYVPAPESFFEGICSLEPGHYLRYRSGQLTLTRYWEPRFDADEEMSERQALQRLGAALDDSAAAHVADGAVAGCLFGSGMDSALLASYCRGGQTFTVGYDAKGDYDEGARAQRNARLLDCEPHCRRVGAREFFDALPRLLSVLEQPLASPTAMGNLFAMELAAPYAKVLLSAEGADELFCGYPAYSNAIRVRDYQRSFSYASRKKLAKLSVKLPQGKLRDLLQDGARPVDESFIGGPELFSFDDKRSLLAPGIPASRPQDFSRRYYQRVNGLSAECKMQYADISLNLANNVLYRIQRISESLDLELRLPFLDTRVFQEAGLIPEELKLDSSSNKYFLRKAAAKRLPEAIVEQPKSFFRAPLAQWMREQWLYSMLADEFAQERTGRYFCQARLQELLEEHVSGDKDNSRGIWAVHSFLVWEKLFFVE